MTTGQTLCCSIKSVGSCSNKTMHGHGVLGSSFSSTGNAQPPSSAAKSPAPPGVHCLAFWRGDLDLVGSISLARCFISERVTPGAIPNLNFFSDLFPSPRSSERVRTNKRALTAPERLNITSNADVVADDNLLASLPNLLMKRPTTVGRTMMA